MIRGTQIVYACLIIWLSCCLQSWSRLSKCPALSSKDSEKAFTIWPKSTVLAGSNVTLRCRVPQTKRWRRQLAAPSNMYILTPSGYQMCQTPMTPGNDLSCAMNMNQVHAGNGGYSVCVLNQGQTNCMLGEERLKVVDPETSVFPQVALLSTNVSSSRQVGHQFHIFCQATGRPQPMITWMKDDVAVENESDTLIRQVDRHTSELIIMSLRLKHQGSYSCAASNILGEAYSSKDKALQISPGPPVITLQPVNHNVTMTTNVTLACAAVGYPFPSVRWLKNGVAMEDSGVMERDKEGTTWLLLELKNVNKSDFGDYQCVASNEMGRDKSKLAALVKERTADCEEKSPDAINKTRLIYWLIASIVLLLILIIILLCVVCIIAAKKQKITVITKSAPVKSSGSSP